jgi:arylsulfatase A-like enzyme
MKTAFKSLLLLTAASTFMLSASFASAQTAPANPVQNPTQRVQKQPNFLVIVADDLGFSDLGAFGGEIHTPNLDALANHGLRLTGFHSAPTCSPTRSMLLSGTDSHTAGLGTMAELIAPNQKGQPGYEGYLRPDVATLADRLGAGGYRTIMSGKWHLGVTPEQDPSKRGFQQSFTLLQGGHNHFGSNITLNPLFGATYRENGKTLTDLPKDFYSSDYFTTKLLSFLEETAPTAKPFFAYLTFTAPHWPLQAPASDIAKYHGRYDAGFEALRQERLEREAELGLIDASKPAHDLVLKNGGWAKLSPTEKAEQVRLMEVYAAMVDRLDQNVGRVVEYLKRTGQYDNTVILFTSDNGAEGMDIRTAEIAGIKAVVARADNSPENIGKATSYLSYGPGWAQAATAPSRLFKAYTTEGGTRVAAFVTYGKLARQGVIGSAFGTVQDVVPTFLDLAGLPAATTQFEGRTVAAVTGTSWAPYLQKKLETVHPATEAVGWELFGNRAIRQGDWKIVRLFDGNWELFNVVQDPGETKDLSKAEPARLAALSRAWDAYAKRVNVIIPSDVVYKP